jgi:hypothetical protein
MELRWKLVSYKLKDSATRSGKELYAGLIKVAEYRWLVKAPAGSGYQFICQVHLPGIQGVSYFKGKEECEKFMVTSTINWFNLTVKKYERDRESYCVLQSVKIH